MSETPHVRVREATSYDVPYIVNLVESVYRGETSKKGWTTEADLLDGQRTDQEMILELMKKSIFLVAQKDNKIVASVQLEKREGYAYIGMLSVDVNAQNLKLGRRMLDECDQYAHRHWHFKETRITVIERRKELVNWYERRGYKLTGRTEPFHQDPRFGIPKVNDLLLVEMSRAISEL